MSVIARILTKRSMSVPLPEKEKPEDLGASSAEWHSERATTKKENTSLVIFGNKVREIYNEYEGRSVKELDNELEVKSWFNTLKQSDKIANEVLGACALKAFMSLADEDRKGDKQGYTLMDAYFRA